MTTLVNAQAAERHRVVAGTFAEVAASIGDWDAQTPVPEWKSRDVVAHLTAWLPEFLGAHQVVLADEPADRSDPVAAFEQLSRSVQQLLDAADAGRMVESSMLGPIAVNRLIDQFYTADVFMHTWDLARSNGIEPDLDSEFAATLRRGLVSMGPALQQSGQFGAPHDVPPGADEVTQLMAFVGRDPNFAVGGTP